MLVKAPGSVKAYDLALFTLDTKATRKAIIERYSWRWPVEPSNAAGKQIMGVGDACNRLDKAVERTVPSGFLVRALLITWYARCGYNPVDITTRRLLCPWYRAKAEPSVADMLDKLRREFLKARFSAIRSHPPRTNRGLHLDLRHHRRITRKDERGARPGNHPPAPFGPPVASEAAARTRAAWR